MSQFPLHKALRVAEYIFKLLQPHCERIDIAGSIRRRSESVKDIEILCTAKREWYQNGLFKEDGSWLISKDFSEGLAIITEKVVKGNVTGRYMQIITNSKNCPGIKLDLFMPAPDDYYRQLVIRTGNWEYVRNIIASAWIRKGWCGVKDLGLRKITDCTRVDEKTWRLVKADNETEKPPVWQSEEEVFAWLGIKFLAPQFRNIHDTLNKAQ